MQMPDPSPMTNPSRSLSKGRQARVVDGKLRGGERELDEDVHLLDVFLIDELERVEALHLAGDPRREVRRVEPRDRPDAALAREKGVPVWLRPDGERGHQPDARHHYSPAQSGLRPTSFLWRATRCTRWLP